MHTILVIDDETQIVGILEEFLVSHGFKVEKAYNGREGLDKLRGGTKADLILLDEKMPEMGGSAFRKGLKEMGVDIPVIVLTGSVGLGKQEKFDDRGFDHLLFKPIRLTELHELICKILTS
jgi:CheY-like chemotaxis protein